MAPPRRQASKKADEVNKQIVQQTLVGTDEDAEFELDKEGMQMANDMSVDSSPLSVRSRTPTPGSGLDTGLEFWIRQELAEKPRPTLVQQVAKLKESGLNVGEMIKFGKAQEKVGGQADGNKQSGWIPTTKDNRTTSRNNQMDKALNSTKLQKQPLNTTPKKRKTSKASNGLLPSNSTPHGALGALKRPIAAYLENSPENGQREREHKRPAQRRWDVPWPSGPIRMPLNMVAALPPHFQERNPKVLNDADNVMKLYGMIHNHCDLSHLRALEIRNTNDPAYTQVPGFPGLLAYNRFVGTGQGPKTDGLDANERRMQVFNYRTQTGVSLTEDEEEECRLRSKLLTILGDQRSNFEQMRQIPEPAESFDPHKYFQVDLSILALMKLKPATKKKSDPPLFANGSWYSSKRIEDEDSLGCTFCMFDCDYGISDERVWLPMEASGGFCRPCHLQTQTSIYEWDLSTNASPEEYRFDPEKQARIDELCGKAANPPLKELGDDVGFKKRAMQLRQQNLNKRRQIELASLGRIPNTELSQHQVMSVSNSVQGQNSPEDRHRVLDAQRCQQQVMSAFNGTSGDHISPFVPRNATTNGVAIQQQQQAMSKSASKGIPDQTPTTTTGRPTTLQRVVKNTEGQTSKKGASTMQKQQKVLTSMTGQPSMTGACASTMLHQQQSAANMAGRTSTQEIGVIPEQNQAVVSGSGRKRSDTRTDAAQAMDMLFNMNQGRQDFIKQHLVDSAQGQFQRRISDSMPSSPALSQQTIDNADRFSNPQQIGPVVDGHPRRTSFTGLPQQSPIMERGMNNQRIISGGFMSPPPAFSPELNRNGNGTSDVQHMGATARSHQRRPSYTGLPPPNTQTRVDFMGGGAAGDVMNHQRRTSSGPMSMPSSPMIAEADGFPNAHHRRISSGSMRLSSPPMATENRIPNGQQNAWSGPGSSPLMQSFTPNGAIPGKKNQGHHRRTSSSSMAMSSLTMMLPSHSPIIGNGNGSANAPQNGHQVNGPGPSPPMQSIMEDGMPRNYYPEHHRRTSSGSMSLSSPTLRATANIIRKAQQHSLVSNGPGGSAVIHPLMADLQMPMNYIRQRRLSNGSMMVSSPIMMAYGSEAATVQEGQAVTSSGGNPPMQLPTLNAALPVNNAQQRRLSNSTPRRDAPPMIPTVNGTPDGQQSRAINRGGDPGRLTVAPEFRKNAGSPSMAYAVANYSNQRHPLNRANLPVQVIQLSRSGVVIGPTTLPPVQTTSSNASEEAARATHVAKKVSAPRNPPDPRSIRSFDGASESPPKQNDARTHPRGSSPASANAPVTGLGIINGPRMTEGARFGSLLRKNTASQMLSKQANERRSANTARAFPTPSMSPEAQSSTSMPEKLAGPFVPPSLPPGFATPDHITGPVVPPSQSPASTISDFSMSPFPPFQDPMSMTPNLAMIPLIPSHEVHAHPHAPTLRHTGSSPLPNTGIMGPPPLPAAVRKSVSQPSTSRFLPVTFCRGCPWRQIDIKKARICEPCKAQKLEIIKHKHVYFSSLYGNRGLDGERYDIGCGTFSNTQRRTCMVCPALAEGQCRDCPLRLCSDCQVMMKQMGKLPSSPFCGKDFADDVWRLGKDDITKLIQHYCLNRAHLRNDVSCSTHALTSSY
jgi:hypothetical protein